jgi:tripartite ATP-independent transporter DctM subunit
MPALVRAGYPERFSMGLIAGTGSVGLLFPPALPLFIYGTICGLNVVADWAKTDPRWAWDTQRFIFAGIVPGLVLMGMLAAVAVTVAIIRKLPRTKFSFKELGESFLLALPELGIPFGVIAALAHGFQLSEVAALTVAYAAILELGVSRVLNALGIAWGKPLQPRVLWTMSREAMAMIGAIFIIIFASQVLTNYMVTADIPQKLVEWTQAHVQSKIVFLLAINVILLIVGTVMDIFSAIVVVVPLLLKIAYAYHISPYHLGVIFLLNLEVGYLHPPVGLNLFITSVKFQRPITEVMWATIPFLITMIATLLVVTYVPALTEISTPDPPRTAPISNLVTLVHVAADELTVVKEVTLVDSTGKPLPGGDGKPIVRHLDDCAKLGEQDKSGCERLFFDVKGCKRDANCEHGAIAKWVIDNNSTWAKEQQIVLVTDVPLVDSDGNPKKDKSDQPIVKHIADCAKDADNEDSCRELFIKVSNCQISPNDMEANSHGDVEKCKRTAISDWVDANQ